MAVLDLRRLHGAGAARRPGSVAGWRGRVRLVVMADHVRVREIDDDEGRRLLRIVRRDPGSAVTWRRAQMVLLPAQAMAPAKIAEVTFTSPDRVCHVIRNFSDDGFGSVYPRYPGGRPRKFTLPGRREIKKTAKSRPAEHGLVNNVEIACTPASSSWLTRIEAQFAALRRFALDGTGHRSHKEQASMNRRCIIWRNQHAADKRLRAIVERASAA